MIHNNYSYTYHSINPIILDILIQTIIPKASDNNPEKYSHHPFITHHQKKIIKLLTSHFKYVIMNLIRKNCLTNRQLNSLRLCVRKNHSDAAQAVGFKKKSERKRPTKKKTE